MQQAPQVLTERVGGELGARPEDSGALPVDVAGGGLFGPERQGDDELGNLVGHGRGEGPAAAVVDDRGAARQQLVERDVAGRPHMGRYVGQLGHLAVVEGGDQFDVQVGHRVQEFGQRDPGLPEELPALAAKAQGEADPWPGLLLPQPRGVVAHPVVGDPAHGDAAHVERQGEARRHQVEGEPAGQELLAEVQAVRREQRLHQPGQRVVGVPRGQGPLPQPADVVLAPQVADVGGADEVRGDRPRQAEGVPDDQVGAPAAGEVDQVVEDCRVQGQHVAHMPPLLPPVAGVLGVQGEVGGELVEPLGMAAQVHHGPQVVGGADGDGGEPRGGDGADHVGVHGDADLVARALQRTGQRDHRVEVGGRREDGEEDAQGSLLYVVTGGVRPIGPGLPPRRWARASAPCAERAAGRLRAGCRRSAGSSARWPGAPGRPGRRPCRG